MLAQRPSRSAAGVARPAKEGERNGIASEMQWCDM